MELHFRVLGSLEVCRDGAPIRLQGPKQRVLLASLVVRGGRVASIDQLIDDMWAESPPAQAHQTITSYIGRLRRLLQPGVTPNDSVVRGSRFGYAIAAEGTDSDLRRFEKLTAAGRSLLSEGDNAAASRALTEALALWRGPCLLDVPSRHLRQTVAVRMEEARLSTLESRIDADLSLGQHSELVGELEELTARHPTRERLHVQRMLALYRAGRQTEALEVYRQLRSLLVEEFGLEPGEELRKLEQAMLNRDPGLDLTAPVAVAAPARVTTPHQLPPTITDFTGRASMIAAVGESLSVGDARAGLPVAIVSGQAGVGKSTLVNHVAHGLRESFPDGQLYVDLSGGRSEYQDPGEVLIGFLRALGVPATDIPRGLDERGRVYRDALDDRRVLVVLDNAAEESQVRPLLPGSPRNAVLITSRSRLAALEGAHRHHLDVLSADECLALTEAVIGAERLAGGRESAERIIDLCGRLPLAVRVVASRLAAKPHWSLEHLLHRLSDERRRLDELTAGDLEVRASVALSYDNIPPDQRRAFRALGALPSTDIPVWAAAAVLHGSPEEAEEALEGLLDVHLLNAAGVDSLGRTRYVMHDLIRDVARELYRDNTYADAQMRALRRLADTATALGDRAHHDLPGGPRHRLLSELDPHFAGHSVAAEAERVGHDWLLAETRLLTSLVEHTHRLAETARACRLAYTAYRALATTSQVEAAERVLRLGIEAAADCGQSTIESHLLVGLSWLLGNQARYSETITALERARELPAVAGAPGNRGDVLRALGFALHGVGRAREAIEVYEQSLEEFRRDGDLESQGFALQALGTLHERVGDHEGCVEYLRQALEVFTRLGNERGRAHTLYSLGLLYLATARPDEAETALTKALGVFEELESPRVVAYARYSLGETYRKQGRHDEALRLLRQARSAGREFRDRRLEAFADSGTGATLRCMGDIDASVASLERALELATGFDEAVAADVRYELALTCRDSGDLERAARYLRAALATFQTADFASGVDRTARQLAEVEALLAGG